MDNKLTLAVKELAYSLGADLVGIANIERFENAPIKMSPKGILPNAKSSSARCITRTPPLSWTARYIPRIWAPTASSTL